MKIDDIFMNMIMMMLIDEQIRVSFDIEGKEVDSPEKIEIDIDEINKAFDKGMATEKMYEKKESK